MVEIVEGPKLVSQADAKRFQAREVMNLINMISVRQTQYNFVIYLIELKTREGDLMRI